VHVNDSLETPQENPLKSLKYPLIQPAVCKKKITQCENGLKKEVLSNTRGGVLAACTILVLESLPQG